MPESEDLETLVNKHGLVVVLTMLREFCLRREHHLRSKDEAASRSWRDCARRIDTCTEAVERRQGWR